MSRLSNIARTRIIFMQFLLCLMATLSACTNSGLAPTEIVTSANKALSALPKPDLDLSKLSNDYRPPVGTPTAIYTRIARGALTCWLGAHGPLNKTHKFYANAEPAHRGGGSRIVIYEIPNDPQRKLGDRAYSIIIDPDGASGRVRTENTRLSKKLAAEFDDDVMRWAANKQGCVKASQLAEGWSANIPKNQKKPKKK